jgi:hypothetical protein
VTIRSSNYVILEHGELSVTNGDKIRNQVWFAELDEELQLQNLRQIDFSNSGYSMERGVEDPKLLWRNGQWMFTAVAAERSIPVARHCECYMNAKTTAVEKIVLYEGVNAMKPEKNWMTSGNKPKNFDYVYGPNSVVSNGLVISKLHDNKKIAGLRGNTHLLELKDGTYLAIMHHLAIRKGQQKFLRDRFIYVDDVQKIYMHYFVRIDEHGTIVEISDPFHFISRGIEFAAGIVEKDDNYVISFGKDDVSSHVGIIPCNKVKKLLKKV